MERLEYEIEFITPAFIGGADPGEYAELRPASFVGLLRYWFRAIVGAYTENTKELFNLESELFGSQEVAGKVWIRVKGNAKEKLKCKKWIAKRDSGKDWGKVYMGYGNILYVNFKNPENRKRFRNLLQKCREQKGDNTITPGYFSVKPWLEAKNYGQQTKLEVIFPGKIREKIEALLFIVSQIGCIGSRSRRGWGSFYLKPINNNTLFSNWNFWNKEELKHAFNILCGGVPENMEFYMMDGGYSKALDALEIAGILFRRFRSRKEPDYSNVKNFISSNISNGGDTQIEIKKAYLGLPIRFIFQSLNGKEAEVNTKTGRFASPLRFKVIRISNNLYTCLLIHIRDQLIPDEIFLKSGNKQIVVQKPTANIVENFIKENNKFVREYI